MDAVLEQTIPKLRAIASEAVARHRIPGTAVGVLRGVKLAWSAGFGSVSLDRDETPDENTVFRCASITKPFTATAVLQLRERHLLGLDDPLVLHLPEFTAVVSRHGPLEDVTLRRLMCHRSGLVSESAFNYWDDFEFPDMATVLGRLPDAYVAIPPDSADKYSNLGFALLGEVISRLSGIPYDRYIRENIFEPLGMTTSAFTLTPELGPHMADGYVPQIDASRPAVSPHPPLNGLDAAGSLYTTVGDLAKWIGAHIDAGEGGGASVLSAESFAEMHRIQYIDTDDWTGGRAISWVATRSGNRIYHGHGGSVPGFRTGISFCKKYRTGVIFLTNLGGHSAPEDSIRPMMDAILEVEEATPKEADSPDLSPTPTGYELLIGTYATYQGTLTQLVWRDSGLRLLAQPGSRAIHAPTELVPTDDPRVFTARGGRPAGEPAVFTMREDGRAESFALGGAVYRRTWGV